jgi:tRNA_anti-like
MLKKILTGVILLGAVGLGVGYYMWNKPVESTTTKSVEISLTAGDLASQFDNAKHLGKVIEVKGKITEITTENDITNITLETSDPMTAISCEMEKGTATPSVKAGEEVTLKGQCDGKLSDVVLTRCILIK